ncbi:cytidine and dCMP deaminase domain-containing protein 1 isoform X2 [Phycodurus eques]|uniref:cytidine and dCMP deaminase domain-containing protein 1 isoform X2 n=1 Tax=Phycodurus eques TaxID=693459 RepID=UPI002ACEDF27|nr:cytidine and dCMP deaminase domain-containing protein 1 isoform X2 [Phycodurus eques]
MEDSRRETRPLTADFSSQTISVVQGHGPRLSKINLITLLSLWLELFPQEQPEEDDNQIRSVGLVVVRDSKVVGLHCSGHELHAGQAAIIQHAARLADCQLYFSRRPCATCLKMIINAGVSQISFWPGDPEFSMLSSDPHAHTGHITEEAALDALATEKLKSNSSSHICLLLQPLAAGMVQFVGETSRECDFMGMATDDNPGLNTEELFYREQEKHLEDFSKRFLIEDSRQHREILTQMHLENFCVEPYFSNLRHNMREVVKVLAAVAAGVPEQHYGFHRETLAPDTLLTGSSPCPYHEGVSQEIARHCIIQARLLAYRTEDPKVGVGAVIWANKQLCPSRPRLALRDRVICPWWVVDTTLTQQAHSTQSTRSWTPNRRTESGASTDTSSMPSRMLSPSGLVISTQRKLPCCL